MRACVCVCVSQSLSIYICMCIQKSENHIFFPLNHPLYLPPQKKTWPHDHGWLGMAIWDPQSFGQRVLRFALALVDQKAKGVIIRALLELDPGPRGLVDVARMLRQWWSGHTKKRAKNTG